MKLLFLPPQKEQIAYNNSKLLIFHITLIAINRTQNSITNINIAIKVNGN